MSGAGVIKFFSSEKGYGFIRPDDGGADVFLHISALRRTGLDSVAEGQAVTYDVEPGKDGKGPKAANIKIEKR